MTLTIGIANSITGTGQASDQLPAQCDIVASYQNSVTADNTQWIDTNASGAYEVEEGHSWLADGTAYGALETPVTITGDFIIKVGMSAPDISSTKRLFGGVTLDGLMSIDTSGKLLLGIAGTTYTLEPATPIIDSFVVRRVGSTLYLDYKGNTVSTAGSSSDITYHYIGRHFSTFFTGNIWDINIEDSTDVVFSNFLAQDSTDMKMLSEVGPDVQFTNGTYPIIDKSVEYGHEWSNYSVVVDDSKIPQDPTNLGFDVIGNPLTNPGTPQKNITVTGHAGTFDGTAYLALAHLSGTETVSSSTGTSTPTVSAGKIDFTIGWCSRVILDDGTDLVIESNPASMQDTVYNIADTNHATLTSATLPFFTTEMEGSKLFADGFDNVGGSDGLVPAGANSGQLTNQPTEFIDDYCLFDAPLSVSFYDAAVVAGIDTDLYLAGAAIGLTADAWILLASNPLFFGAVKNILVMYNDTQSGDTLDQINDYLGI